MTQTLTAHDIIQILLTHAPATLAEAGDPIGLQVGRLNKPVKRVWIALEPSPQVVTEAILHQVDLLITHHAMIYRGTRSIDTATARGRAIGQALAADLTIYTAHTNLDAADGGVNDQLVSLLQLQQAEVLERSRNEKLQKLVVFVPESHHEQVLSAVCEAGAGHIGAYSHCTFNTPGTGTFVPTEGTNPFLGQVGRLERAQEVRLETVVPEQLVEPVVRAMLAAHPYEEVAYDLYNLEIMGKTFGIGRIGNLQEPCSLAKFAVRVRDALGLPHIRYSGDENTMVSRVAVVGGAGHDFIQTAMAKKADVLVTSDVDHHDVAEAWQDGLSIVDATHAALERPVLQQVKQWLNDGLSDTAADIDIEVCDLNEDPFRWV